MQIQFQITEKVYNLRSDNLAPIIQVRICTTFQFLSQNNLQNAMKFVTNHLYV